MEVSHTVRVLLVDDERLLLTMMGRALRALRPDWELEVASDGHEAMRLLRSRKVDMLVTDLQMPGMDGMALLMQVRRDPDLARLPLILISAQDDRSSMRQGICLRSLINVSIISGIRLTGRKLEMCTISGSQFGAKYCLLRQSVCL